MNATYSYATDVRYGGAEYFQSNQQASTHQAYSSSAAGFGIFLVSDGGHTLSSINDPSLNTNNPNAPINATDVSTPVSLGLLGLAWLAVGGTSRRRQV